MIGLAVNLVVYSAAIYPQVKRIAAAKVQAETAVKTHATAAHAEKNARAMKAKRIQMAKDLKRFYSESLPAGFQKSEYLFDHGMVDMVVARNELRGRLIRLIRFLIDPRPTADIANLDAGNLEIPETSNPSQTPVAEVGPAPV